MPDPPNHPVTSLYVHVPFCARKCDYCAFYSETAQGEIVNRYVRALIREMELVAGDMRPRTIFFGGGTPSLLNLHQWERVLGAMDELGLCDADEWTVECNPATVSLDKAKLLREHGVTRISLGVQSFDAALLGRLGRIHSREQVFKSFELLRRAGFDNVNLDLMFAIPGQTLEMWRSTLAQALGLGSEHLSGYEVIYEDDTPLFNQLHAGKFSVDEDLACAMYDELVERADSAGFRQYEIANFARIGDRDGRTMNSPRDGLLGAHHSAPASSARLPIPSLACRHNVNYWRGGAFHGLGPSATSYARGVRKKNWPNTPLYCDHLEQGRRAIESCERLAPLARAGETAAFGLRMLAGWPFEEFRRVTSFDLRDEWSEAMRALVECEWGRITPEDFRLTRTGLRFADAAAEMFLR